VVGGLLFSCLDLFFFFFFFFLWRWGTGSTAAFELEEVRSLRASLLLLVLLLLLLPRHNLCVTILLATSTTTTSTTTTTTMPHVCVCMCVLPHRRHPLPRACPRSLRDHPNPHHQVLGRLENIHVVLHLLRELLEGSSIIWPMSAGCACVIKEKV
jgi:hypothetical protein